MWKKRFSKLHEKDFRKVNTIIQKSNSDFTGIKNCPVKTSYLYTSYVIRLLSSDQNLCKQLEKYIDSDALYYD